MNKKHRKARLKYLNALRKQAKPKTKVILERNAKHKKVLGVLLPAGEPGYCIDCIYGQPLLSKPRSSKEYIQCIFRDYRMCLPKDHKKLLKDHGYNYWPCNNFKAA